MQETLKDRYINILNKVDTLKTNSDVELVAISKYHSAAKIRELYNIGHRTFGENYLSELVEKYEQLKDLSDIKWYFSGHIQSNKIKQIVKYCDAVLSLSSEKHARKFQKELENIDKKNFQAYIAINLANEESKTGVSLSGSGELANFVTNNCPNIQLMGLMSIPPKVCENRITVYKNLREACNSVGEAKLSLGMSSDLEDALKVGTNQVRIGTAIFGERNYDRK